MSRAKSISMKYLLGLNESQFKAFIRAIELLRQTDDQTTQTE